VLRNAALSGAVVLAATFVAVAVDDPPPVVHEIEVTTQGASASFEPTRCGGVAYLLAGRVLRRSADGNLIPLPEAKLSYVGRDGASVPLRLIVGQDGRFDEPTAIMGGRYYLSSSGVDLEPNARRGRLQLVVSAPGCVSKSVKFGAEGEARDVVLRCPELQ
jgi:hypothetical protein